MIFALFGFGEEDFSFSEEYATVTDKIKFSEKSEIINRINTNKNIGRTNDDIFSGIPLNKVLINGTEYIMPYYDMSKTYDGDLYFQSKGGWGKNIKSNGIIYDNKVTNYSDVTKFYIVFGYYNGTTEDKYTDTSTHCTIFPYFEETGNVVLANKISDNIKQFEWKETGETSYGFVAQDLEVNHPELVNDNGNTKTVNYNAALSLVIAKLENRVKELEAKLGIESSSYI